VVLSDEEFRLLRLGKLSESPDLFNSLEDKGIIVTEKNINKVVEDFRERYHFLFKGPSLHIVVPTFRCNQKCIYCHSFSKPVQAKGYDMDEETARAIVDFIFKSPTDTLVIEFQGGDCLLNFDAVKTMVEYAEKISKDKNRKVLFSLVTNLTMMNEEILKFLKEHSIMGIATSLDGPREVHDENRKYISGSGTYDDVVYWIKRLKGEYKKDFNLNALTTITRHSLSYAKEIPDELYKLGFDGVWLRFLNNLGFAKREWSKIGYTPEEYLRFWKESSEHIMNINKKGKFFAEIMTQIIAKKILNKRDPMFVDLQKPCGAAIGQLLYDYKGDIFTCDEAKIDPTFKLGNVKETEYNEVFRHPTVTSMIDLSSLYPVICDSCVWSPYCGICLVNIYKSRGTIVPNLATDFRCKIMKEAIRHVFKKLIFFKNDRKIYLDWIKKEGQIGEKISEH
jgi:His-Xaa-Ser system radical SAM maturase HxsB